MNVRQLFVVIAIAIIGVLLLAVFVFFLSLFRPWLRAFLSGTPVSLFQLIGMKFRRSDANLIIGQGIAANQAGHPIPWYELERAYVQRIDLEKIVTAYITAKKRDENFTFQELVDAEHAVGKRV